MPFIVLPGGGDLVIIGQKTLREKLGIDVMAQLDASVLKAHVCQDDAGVEFSAVAVGEPNPGAVPRAAMAVTAFVPGGDASGDVEDEATLTLLCQRPMMFQDSEVEMQDRVGALERRRSMTLLTMACGRNVSGCCAISFFDNQGTVFCLFFFGDHPEGYRVRSYCAGWRTNPNSAQGE